MGNHAEGLTRVMAIDPSLTRTGVCALDYAPLVGGAIANNYAVLEAVKVASDKKQADLVERSKLMAHETMELLALIKPDEVVIEIPEGRVTSRHGGGGSGLAKYGYCVGMMYGTILAVSNATESLSPKHSFSVVPVGSSFWTQGFGAAKRRKKALHYVPSLANVKDPGGDIADATALAAWWIQIGRNKDSCLST